MNGEENYVVLASEPLETDQSTVSNHTKDSPRHIIGIRDIDNPFPDDEVIRNAHRHPSPRDRLGKQLIHDLKVQRPEIMAQFESLGSRLSYLENKLASIESGHEIAVCPTTSRKCRRV